MEKRKIAITGGIGSGKSYVCKLLAKRGIEVYDCDANAKRLMIESEDIREKLQQLIGEQAYIDGQLNKAVIAAFMMESEKHTLAVNAIVHPAVYNDYLSRDTEWMESAILFDCGLYRYFDIIICVSAPEEVRIQRVMQRDHITREKTLEWIHKQWPQDDVIAGSDYEIINDGVADLNQQIDYILNQLKDK